MPTFSSRLFLRSRLSSLRLRRWRSDSFVRSRLALLLLLRFLRSSSEFEGDDEDREDERLRRRRRSPSAASAERWSFRRDDLDTSGDLDRR